MSKKEDKPALEDISNNDGSNLSQDLLKMITHAPATPNEYYKRIYNINAQLQTFLAGNIKEFNKE